jgi:signal transduction histidine kinase
MTIHTRIISGYLLIGLIMALTGTIILARLEKGPEELAEVRKSSLYLIQSADSSIRDAVKESLCYFFQNDGEGKSSFYASIGRFDRAMADFSAVKGKESDEEAREAREVAVILQTRGALVRKAEELFRQYGERGRVDPGVIGEYHGLAEKIEVEVAALIRKEKEDLDNAYSRVTKTLTFSRRAHYAVGAFTLILSVVLGLCVSGIISRPISRLTDAAGRMADGDLDVAVDTGAGDEIGELARAFDAMRKSLKEKIGELNAEVAARRRSELELEEYASALERERFAAEQARLLAEAANRVKSEFLANMSHELRTPLNAVIGFADVLKDGLGGELSPKQEGYVDNIRTSGRHLHGMIEDMLDLAQMEAGTVELRAIPFHLREVLTGALSRFREKATSRGISLSLEMEPEVEGEVRSDPAKLKQILHNLLSNAVKFTPDGGSVRVSARRVNDVGAIHELPLPHDGDFIEISVEDTGIGIRAEDIPRIFEGLTQLESPYSKTYGGAGLGLVLTKKLVERLGGVIRVESEIGRGSRFTVDIPAESEAGQGVS